MNWDLIKLYVGYWLSGRIAQAVFKVLAFIGVCLIACAISLAATGFILDLLGY